MLDWFRGFLEILPAIQADPRPFATVVFLTVSVVHLFHKRQIAISEERRLLAEQRQHHAEESLQDAHTALAMDSLRRSDLRISLALWGGRDVTLQLQGYLNTGVEPLASSEYFGPAGTNSKQLLVMVLRSGEPEPVPYAFAEGGRVQFAVAA